MDTEENVTESLTLDDNLSCCALLFKRLKRSHLFLSVHSHVPNTKQVNEAHYLES